MSLFEQGGQHVGSQYNAAGDIYINPPDKQNQADLRILLGNVERTWLAGVLDNSLYNQLLLSLGKELRAEAIDHPWSMVFENPAQERKSLPPEKKIKEIFREDANRLLLILGEPGSGKTITLLQLARELINDLKQAPAFTHPIPIIFNLSTWTNKKEPLTDWLVMELLSKYRVPKKDGRRWLKEKRILLFLDGLDEVKAENRTACVEQINQLKGEYGLYGMVVCSRFKEYDALEVCLQFSGAIYLQPLTATQISQYLSQIGHKLTGLRQALPQDEVLQELAHSPLMLNIMSLAYEDRPAEEIITPHLDTVEARRPHLFDTYIRRMFRHKGKRYSQHKEEIKKRLAWLASNMQWHNQDIFQIEGLQPTWLAKQRWRWSYILASRSIIFEIIPSILLCFNVIVSIYYSLKEICLYNINCYISADIEIYPDYNYIIIELFFNYFLENLEINVLSFFIVSSFLYIICYILYILTYKLILKIVYEMVYINIKLKRFINVVVVGLVGLSLGLIFGPNPGLLFGLIFGLIFGLRASKQNASDIQPVEALIWSWHQALKNGLLTYIYSFPIFFIFTLIQSINSSVFIFSYSVIFDILLKSTILYIFISILYIPVFIFNGLIKGIVETKSYPNQGIALSIKNAVWGGLIGLITGIIIGGVVNYITEYIVYYIANDIINLKSDYDLREFINIVNQIFFINFINIFPIILIGVLWYGGLDVIKHYTLRAILIYQGHTPRKYADFLDDAAKLIFLQKVGGGYRFIHRLLRDHFAKMHTEKGSEEQG